MSFLSFSCLVIRYCSTRGNGANASKCNHRCVYGWVWGNCITVSSIYMENFNFSFTSVSFNESRANSLTCPTKKQSEKKEYRKVKEKSGRRNDTDKIHRGADRLLDIEDTHLNGTYGKFRFHYDPALDCYFCPQDCLLKHTTTSREGYRQYCCDTKNCQLCPKRTKCCRASSKRKMVTRHVWQNDPDQADFFTKTPTGKNLYAWRKQTIERSFANAKQPHWFRYARMRGNASMRGQALLTAAV